MNQFIRTYLDIKYFEKQARKEHWLMNLHPLVKVLVTFIYLLLVISADIYDVDSVLLYGVYPMTLIFLSDTDSGELFKRMLVPVLIGSSFGILNPFFDRQLIYLSESIVIRGGYLSFLTLVLKSIMVVSSGLLLISTTTIEDIAYSLQKLHIPKIMVIHFLLTFRYIMLMIEEVDKTITAYSMRSQGRRTLHMSAWGSLLGQIFIRTSNRAATVYEAMKLRGFEGEFKLGKRRLGFYEAMYLVFWMFVFGIFIVLR